MLKEVELLLAFTYKMFHPLTKGRQGGKGKNLVKMTADPNATKSWDKSFSLDFFVGLVTSLFGHPPTLFTLW